MFSLTQSQLMDKELRISELVYVALKPAVILHKQIDAALSRFEVDSSVPNGEDYKENLSALKNLMETMECSINDLVNYIKSECHSSSRLFSRVENCVLAMSATYFKKVIQTEGWKTLRQGVFRGLNYGHKKIHKSSLHYYQNVVLSESKYLLSQSLAPVSYIADDYDCGFLSKLGELLLDPIVVMGDDWVSTTQKYAEDTNENNQETQ